MSKKLIRIKLTLGMGYLEEVVEEIGKQPSYNDLHYARQEVQRAVKGCERALENLDAFLECVDEPAGA